MARKRTKYVSLLCLLIWSILLVIILTFGTNISLFIQSKISSYLIRKKANNVTLVTDLEIKTEEVYVVGNTYQIGVQPVPYTEEDLQLIYTSLDETIFQVDKKGKLIGMENSLTKMTGTLQITSKRYPDLKKEIQLHFETVYPENVDFHLVHKYGSDIQNGVYLSLPFYVNCVFSNDGKPFSTPAYTVCYDETMLEKVNMNKYIPKKTGITTLICKLENGEEKQLEVEILPTVDENKAVDDIQLIQKNGIQFPIEGETYIAYVGEENEIGIFHSKEFLFTNYQIQSSNTNIALISNLDELIFQTAGQVEITITLENGITFLLPILVKHHLALPVIDSLKNDTLSVTNEISKLIQYQAQSDVPIQFHFDASYLDITEATDSSFYILPKTVGTTFFKIILDDGMEHLEKEYKVIIEKNTFSKKAIIHRVAVFINKYIGHWNLFFIEAIFAFWVLVSFQSKHKIINGILFTSIGSSLAFLTELIQYYMPNRNGCIEDALFDIGCYFLSAGVCYFIYWFSKKRKHKKKKSGEIS